MTPPLAYSGGGRPEATPPERALDRMTVARVLFADGFYDRAEAVLEKISVDSEGIDAAEYWMIRGLVARNLEAYDVAADYFLASIAAGSEGAKPHLLRAHALEGAGRYEEALRTIRHGPKTLRDFPESFLLEAQVQYRRGRRHAAFESLSRGLDRFVDNEKIARQRMFLLIELGLHRAARDAMRAFSERFKAGPRDHIAFAVALQKSGQVESARDLLEMANLLFENEPGIRPRLAAVYHQLGQPVVAAEVLRPLAWSNADIAKDAAELYRKGGALERATRMNQRVLDQREKFRQRLGLLLEHEDYEHAATLYPRLARLGLLEEQPIVYAMAYAFFQIGDFERSEGLLAKLTDQKLFRQGLAIRREIETCRRAMWQCD